MDTVPLGRAPWSRDSFGGEIVDGKLYGRGSNEIAAGRGVVLVLTASEETGCQGAASLSQSQVEMHRAGAVIIGKMTGNVPLVGNKGTLWMRVWKRMLLRQRVENQMRLPGAYGQLHVRPTLLTDLDDNIFAIGDCAACRVTNSDRNVPPRAQAPHQHASFLIKSIKRRLREGQLPEYTYRDLR